ncbi:inositol monophosphatase family protein [Paenibacillus caseinilyticus]|uniref:Inositol-1-monophosphatase n=1 Tax=Paenibacillus mucilaginosus K02 TaxID=997761 RepID=I0BG08_9BACL|nr:inositol monophosphatase family protein [Paenibacillus mucilaginosus]AFH61305.1 myo-inositol-1(or 4)-monophosphatase [Paenibacillus mucilaginosus K02]
MSYLETACSAAKQAGTMILSQMGTGQAAEKKSSKFDVVTEIDKRAEEMIRSIILESYPDHAFLGEEETFGSGRPVEQILEERSDRPYLWIVDPIDGTANFIHGIPGYTVSIALLCRGELRLGVIYDPCRDDLYWAESGKGAFCNGKPAAVTDAEQAEDCVIGTGFVSTPAYREMNIATMEAIGREFRTIRSLGSAALTLAYVACGKLDAFWEYGLSAWDVAAGVLLVEESGGMVTNTKGDPFRLWDRNIAASNAKVHATLLPCLV